MKRLRVEVAIKARGDLRELFLYLRDEGVSASVAGGYLRRIDQQFRKLGDAPFIGRLRNDLQPDLRTIGFERRATIAYRVEPKRVLIVGVFYGGRDYEALLRGDDSSDG